MQLLLFISREQAEHHTVYQDFSNAFDTVNHDILMSKLLHIGIRGVMQSVVSSILLFGVLISDLCFTGMEKIGTY